MNRAVEKNPLPTDQLELANQVIVISGLQALYANNAAMAVFSVSGHVYILLRRAKQTTPKGDIFRPVG